MKKFKKKLRDRFWTKLQLIRVSLFWTKDMKRKKWSKSKHIVGGFILKLQNKF